MGAAIVCACLYEVPDLVGPESDAAPPADGSETQGTETGAVDASPADAAGDAALADARQLGEACKLNTDCRSHLCADFGTEGWQCTAPCADAAPCPAPLDCRGGYCELIQ
jgi:hypothetical protein